MSKFNEKKYLKRVYANVKNALSYDYGFRFDSQKLKDLGGEKVDSFFKKLSKQLGNPNEKALKKVEEKFNNVYC